MASEHNTLRQVAGQLGCAIVPQEANTDAPLKGDFERMARRRFQNPKPFGEGSGGAF